MATKPAEPAQENENQTPLPAVPQETPADVRPAPKPASLEDDPNLKLQGIISRRRTEKAAEEKPSGEQDGKPKEPEKAKPVGDIGKLGVEIGKALGFKPAKEPEREDDKKPEAKVSEDKKGADETAGADASAPKTIVKPKKAAPPAADPVKIATAAATAAVKAVMPERQERATAQSPEETLKSEDLREYEVAKHLAASNPKFKDAPKIVLDHIRKADAYASRWEQENKGKVFDPNDEEHNDFYEALEKPWSDDEFQDAKMEMAAERVEKRKSSGTNQKIQELEQENARISLAPVVDRMYTTAAGILAKRVGEDVHEKIVKNTFDKFAEEDPTTANAMAAAIGPLHSIIEAAIQLDDPKMRFKFDPKNQAHLDWNRLLLEKESQLEGTEDSTGKTMVSRADYVAMNASQRSRHWFLDVGRFIEELVGDAAENAKKMIAEENARLEKFAESRGYVLQKKSAASNGESKEKQDNSAKSTVKPASPSAASASKIDAPTAGIPSGGKKLLETTAGILFSR